MNPFVPKQEHSSLPLVSICIPVYNHEKFVEECVVGVINQDYSNIELIIIDDGSTDNSVRVLKGLEKRCRDRCVRFHFLSRNNKGLSSTLDEAIDWSNGKYFCAIASDDVMLKQKTRTLVEYLEIHIDAAGVFGGIQIIDEHSQITGIKRNYSCTYGFKDIFLHQFFLPAPTQLLRLDVLKKIGGYEAGISIEDWYLWLKITSKGYRLHSIIVTVAQYRSHLENTSKNIERMREGRLEVVSKYLDHPLYKNALATIFLLSFLEYLKNNKKTALQCFYVALNTAPMFVLSFEFFSYIVKRKIAYKLSGNNVLGPIFQ